MKIILMFLIIIILTMPLFADLKKGLVAYYPFNGNAKDESGNGNDGIVYGAKLVTGRLGNDKSAYSFDGTNDYIRIPNSPTLNPNSISLIAWVKFYKHWKGAGPDPIIDKPYISHSSPYYQYHLSATGDYSNSSYRRLGFSISDKKSHINLDTSKNIYELDKWYFITATYDSKNGSAKYYLDGKLIEEKSNILEMYDYGSDVFIANYGNLKGSTYFLPIIIDEIRIYNRALDEKEINSLYTGKNYSKQKFPPDLYIENLKFFEPSNNKALDALEKGKIQFDLLNKGRGNAYDIEIDITPLTSSKNLTYNTKTKIEKITKKSQKDITIPITADINVEDLFREFRIEVTEGNGFDADPAKISFETMAFAAPDLRIEQIAIDDNEDKEGEGFSYGNGNSIIEPNESIEVTAYVQNFGEGLATNVKAEVILTTANRDITYPDEGKIFNIGDIESGDYKKVEFYFYTSRRYDEENIPISIKLTENTGKFGRNVDLGLKLGDRTKNIVDVQVAKIQKKKKTEMKKLDNLIVLSDVDKDIPKTKVDGKNTLAIIVGIEDYRYAPTVDFASNDARVFYQYSKSVFGIPERNIYYRINDGATSGEFNKIFADDGWIARRLKKGTTEVIVYYSGHGAPDTKSEKGYLIPHDIDPNYANTGVSLDFIYSSLSKLQAKSVTLFIDACFSGESRSEEMLIAGIRPITVKIKNPILTTENMAVFSASTGEQYSSAYPEKQHGLFTYFLLKGLQGKAKGSDDKITLDELQSYIYKNVDETAGYLDKEQNPTFIGNNKSRILIKY